MEENFDLNHYIQIFRRRLTFFIVVTSISSIIIGVVAYILPPVYRSTAKILVESQQIPNELARSTVTTNAIERIQIIQQRLMTRNNLLDIARKYALYEDSPFNITQSEIVKQIRQSTIIKQVADRSYIKRPRNIRTAIIFTISFEYENPVIASQVANEFVSLMLEQNIRSRVARASETYEFIEKETNDIRKRLSVIDNRIAEFKQENAGALPSDLQYNKELISSIQNQLYIINQDIFTLDKQQRILQDKKDQEISGLVSIESMVPEEILLLKLKQDLVLKRSKYAENHPYVKLILSQIRDLESTLAANEVDQKLVGEPELTPELELDNGSNQWQSKFSNELEIINEQLRMLGDQRNNLKERLILLEKLVVETPQVELVLNRMILQHQLIQKQYQVSTINLSAANTGEKLEETKQSERLEIVEQAIVDSTPVRPNRVLIISIGTLLSMALGLGMITIMEALNQTVHSKSNLLKSLNVHPFVVVPYIETSEELKKRAVKKGFKIVVPIALISIILLLSHLFYQPINIILEELIDKSKIQEILNIIMEKIKY